MPTVTYEVTEVEQVVKLGVSLRDWWFRGHSKEFKQLTPSIFRSQVESTYYFSPSEVELRACTLFRRNAEALTVGRVLPGERDYLSWLVLMQHYGTPTRLLDWTESALVAFYFAVSSQHSHDAEVWAFYPQALNAITFDDRELSSIDIDEAVQSLAAEAFSRSDGVAALRRRSRLLTSGEYPIAFFPVRSWERMTAQLSAFTIHPVPVKGTTIPELMAQDHLIRYRIPSDRKPILQEALRCMGINEMSLFPDLEGLSRWIRNELVPPPPGVVDLQIGRRLSDPDLWDAIPHENRGSLGSRVPRL